MCGLIKPNVNELHDIEKNFLQTQPLLPMQHNEMWETVNPEKNLVYNVLEEFLRYLSNLPGNPLLVAALVFATLGGLFLLLHQAFPLSFILFWLGVLYISYDHVVFFRAVTTAYLMKRLTSHRRLTAYGVHFRLEQQIDTQLRNLRSIACSILERDWSKSSPELQNSAESFVTAARVITTRLRANAVVSLETAALVWRNNVYAILAGSQTHQEKALAISGKCREAEALLLRFLWLVQLPELHKVLREFIAAPGDKDSKNPYSTAGRILEQYHLAASGPVPEVLLCNFQNAPFEMPFKGRTFWHNRLPPFPLEDETIFSAYPKTRDLLDSLKQVRQLKSHLEEQMAIDCVTRTVSDAAPLEQGYSASMEAKELSRNALYSDFLDIPKFRPDGREMEDAVDRLVAEAKVAGATDVDKA